MNQEQAPHTHSAKGQDRGPAEGAGGDSRDAALALALVLALCYGPALLAGHSIFGGTIQDITNLFGFYPWDVFTTSELASGRFPLWNPHNAFGAPHLANMQTALFYPLNWLKWLFGFWRVIDGVLLLRLWLAGFFSYLLARRCFSAGPLPALAGGAAFMLSGYLTRYVYMSHLNVECLLPLQLWLMHRMAEKPDIKRLAASSAGFALLALGGFPEATLYAYCLAAGFFLFVSHFRYLSALRQCEHGLCEAPPNRAFMIGRTLALLAVCFAAGLLVSAAQWLPFGEYYSQAWTYHDPASGGRSLDIRLAVSLVLPWFFGDNRMSPAAPFLAPYLGAASTLFAAYAAIGFRNARREATFFIMAAILLLALIYGLPPLNLPGRVFPFSLTYNDKYAAAPLALCWAMLAAGGMEMFVRRPEAKKFIVAGGALFAWTGANVLLGLNNGFKPIWALGLKYNIALNALGITTMAAALAFGIIYSRSKISGTAFKALALGAIVVGLLADHQGHRPVYHDRIKEEALEAASMTPATNTSSRLHADPAIEPLFPNLLLTAGRDDIRYYDPLYPRLYVDYMAALNGLSGDSVMEHYNDNMLFRLDPDMVDHPLARLANVGYLVMPHAIDETPLLRDWAANAVTFSPRKESWLRSEYVTSGGVTRLALMDHAPVRVESETVLAGRNRPRLVFEAGLPEGPAASGEGAAAVSGDGVMFLAESAGGLEYARFLAPATEADNGWRSVSFGLVPLGDSVTVALTMLPGPRDDNMNDAGSFAMPRLKIADRGESFELLARDSEGSMYVYRNTRAMPRAWWTRGSSTVGEGADYMDTVRTAAVKSPIIFERVAILADELPEELPGGTASVSAPGVKVVERAPGRTLAEVESPKPGYLNLTNQYFPGFRAFVEKDGVRSETRIYLSNGAFMAVLLPAGKCAVEILYQPRSFRVGLWAGIVSLACLAAAAFRPKTRA